MTARPDRDDTRPTHPKAIAFALMAGIVVAVIVLAVITTAGPR